METFNFGDWVIYDPGYNKQEIGRVTEDRGKSVHVCYNKGCTAANTPKQYLRHATREEIKTASDGIGFHRFDSYCPVAIDCDFLGKCQAWLNMNIDKKGKESEDEMQRQICTDVAVE